MMRSKAPYATIPDELWVSIKASYPLLNDDARDLFESHLAVLRSMNAGDRQRTTASEARAELLAVEGRLKKLVAELSSISDIAYKAMTKPLDFDDHDFLQDLSENYLIEDIEHLGDITKQGPLYAYKAAVLSMASLSMLIQRGIKRTEHIRVMSRTYGLTENLYRFINSVDRIISTQAGGLHIKRGNGVDNEEVPSWLLSLCRLGRSGNEPLGASSVARVLRSVIMHRRVREGDVQMRREKIRKFTTD